MQIGHSKAYLEQDLGTEIKRRKRVEEFLKSFKLKRSVERQCQTIRDNEESFSLKSNLQSSLLFKIENSNQ